MPDREGSSVVLRRRLTTKTTMAMVIVTVAIGGVAACGHAQTAERAVSIGPAFDCTGARQPLAQMLCTDPELARLDLRFGQAYWALYHQVGKAGQRDLKQEDAVFLNAVQQQCMIPKSGLVTPEVSAGRECVRQSYENQRAAWLSRLTGPANEEATRDLPRHIALQRLLIKLGFLAAEDMIEGVYGRTTRAAISIWQVVHQRPPTGFLGDPDATLLEADAQRPELLTAAPSAEKPDGNQPVEPPSGDGLTVTVTPERANTALIIRGDIHNEAKTTREVPRLRVAIRDASEIELAMKVVNAPVDHLDAGAMATFETTFERNDQATGVTVTFVADPPKLTAAGPTAITAPDAVTLINALLADIYSQYPRSISAKLPPPWRMPYASQVFDPPMVVLLEEERRLARESQGIVAFDSDPFCDCQDDEGMRPTVGDIQLTGATAATAKVELRWVCAVSQSPRLSPADRQRLMSDCWREHKDGIVDSKQLLLDLVLVNAEWRIHDIHSPHIASLHQHIIGAMDSVRKVLHR